MIVAVTRLHLRRWRYLLAFFSYARQLRAQVESSAGFLSGVLAVRLPFTFWTVTVWSDEQAMRAFRNTGMHMKAMPNLRKWCDEAAFVHWQQEHDAAPSLAEVFERLRDTGKTSKVDQPSSAHAAGKTAIGKVPRQAGAALKPRRPRPA